MSTRLPSVRTASFAVFHDTSNPSATRATVRCWTTIPSSAHRSPRRDSLACGSAARLVSWRHVPAAGAPIAPDRDQQRRRPPPERLVGQPPGHAVVRYPFASAPTTPARRVVGTDDSAREDSAIWLESLPDDFKSELVPARERGQVRAGEGSVRHVAPIGHPRHEQVSSRLPSRLVSWRQRQNSVSCSARALPWL
jgi:hypothetical protein